MSILTIDGVDVTNDLVSFVQELVQIQSYSGEEGRLAKYITTKMEALGYDEVRIDRYGNVIGRIGRGEKVILFDSHTDTVQVLDEHLWDEPPFSGKIVDGYLWGRGSVDMKSGMAASIYAAAVARSLGWIVGKTVYVTCTVYEEYCDGVGLAHVLQDFNIKPDYAIICEPSDNTIVTGHKGKAQIIIKTHGVSAHGSAPEKGINAVYEMAEIIQRVEQTNLDLMKQTGKKGTLVLSQISSTAVSINAVPSACEIYLDRRLGMGETEQNIRDEIGKIIAGKNATWELGTLRKTTWTGEQMVYEPLHQAWEISLEHDLSRAFIEVYGEVFGHKPHQYDFWDFGTNAIALVSIGTPTIGFGPGEYKLAHMRNEKCEVRQIIDSCEVYTRAIGKL